MDKLTFDDVVTALFFNPECKSIAGYMVSLARCGDAGDEAGPQSFAFAAKLTSVAEYRAAATPMQALAILQIFASKAEGAQAILASQLDSYLQKFDDRNHAHRHWSQIFEAAGIEAWAMVTPHSERFHTPPEVAMACKGLMVSIGRDPDNISEPLPAERRAALPESVQMQIIDSLGKN